MKLIGKCFRAAVLAILAVTILSVTLPARADVTNVSWTRGNSKTLKLAVPTQIGGTVLEPGSYEVKVQNSATGTEIEFSRWSYNPYAAEGLPVYDREVVATIKALPQASSAAPARTELLLASGDGGKAIGLQIRGNNVEYLF
ncbi:MAG: hypothetical protein ACXVZZ_04350 [Terriglobales bacterium]